MSIIVNGKEYPDEKSVPEQYRMYGDSRTRERDPGNFSPDLAPNVGRTVLPHVTTFSGMMSTLARTYRQHDEAIRHNKQNANMMRRDPMIMGPLFARQMAVALLQWQIQPEDSSDEKQCQVAKELTFMVSRIPRFREYLRNLMEAVWYGRYAIQNVWGFTRNSNGVRYRSVVDWVPVNGDKLLFRYDDGTGRFDHDEIGVKVSVAHVKNDVWAGRPDIEWNSEGTGVFLRRWERSRLVVHKNFMMDGDYEDPTTAGMIHGVGLRHFLYWSWYQKQETLAQLAEVVERAGMGFTVYTYPAGNAQAKDEVERLAEEQAHKNQIVLPMEVSNPDAYSIQQIPPNTQGIMALQTLIDDYFGSWIIKFILGQTLSYRAEAGTPGISDLHRDSFLQIVKYDSLGVEETVTNDLIRMLLMFNFPSYKNVNFKFKLNTEEAVPLEKLQALQAAWSMGAKIKSEDVMGLIGLNVAGSTDQALYNPQVLASLKEYEQMEKGEEPQAPAISETQDDALAAMMGPIMQSKDDEPERYASGIADAPRGISHPSKLVPKTDDTLYPEKTDFFSESAVRGNYFEEGSDSHSGAQTEGDLKQVYHGSAAGEFPQHDRRKQGHPEHQLFGPGYYHTESFRVAQTYLNKGKPSFQTNYNEKTHGEKVDQAIEEMLEDKMYRGKENKQANAHLRDQLEIIQDLKKKKHAVLNSLEHPDVPSLTDSEAKGIWAEQYENGIQRVRHKLLHGIEKPKIDRQPKIFLPQSVVSKELQERVGYYSEWTKPTVHSVHLNIKNPFNADEDTIDVDDYLDFLQKRPELKTTGIETFKKLNAEALTLRDKESEAERQYNIAANKRNDLFGFPPAFPPDQDPHYDPLWSGMEVDRSAVARKEPRLTEEQLKETYGINKDKLDSTFDITEFVPTTVRHRTDRDGFRIYASDLYAEAKTRLSDYLEATEEKPADKDLSFKEVLKFFGDDIGYDFSEEQLDASQAAHDKDEEYRQASETFKEKFGKDPSFVYDGGWRSVAKALSRAQEKGDLSDKFSINQTLNQYLRDEGYDGITHIGGKFFGDEEHRVWIAFRPEQIKRVTNTSPTKDPRMDYDKDAYAKKSDRASTRRKAERLIGHIRNQGIIPDVDVAKTGTHYITLDGPDSRVKVRVADHADAYGTSDYTVDDIEGTYEGAKQFVADWIAKERAESDDFSEELDDFSDRKSAFKKLKQEHVGLAKQIADKHEGNIKTPDGEVWYPVSIDLDKFNNADLHDRLLIDKVSEYVQRAKDTLGIESGKSEEYAKKEKSGNYKPNQGMKGNAKRGLELRKKHGKGGTSVGVARARDIMNGKGLSFSTVKRMHSFFSRHAGNEEGGEDDAGYIAWLLWGGDSGRNWARSIVESKEKNSKDSDRYEEEPEDLEDLGGEMPEMPLEGLETPPDPEGEMATQLNPEMPLDVQEDEGQRAFVEGDNVNQLREDDAIPPEGAVPTQGTVQDVQLDPRMAKVVEHLVTGNVETVEADHFASAMAENKGFSTLTPYTVEELSNMTLSKLPDAEVYWALKPYTDDEGNEQIDLVSVINNDSLHGVGAAGAVLHALENGVTTLDAFAVIPENSDVPILPKIYGRFGFEVTWTGDWDASYFPGEEGQKRIANMMDYWSDNGWVPQYDEDGEITNMPGAMGMAFTGGDDERRQARESYLRSGTVLAGRVAFDGQRDKRLTSAKYRRLAGGPDGGSGEGGGDTGEKQELPKTPVGGVHESRIAQGRISPTTPGFEVSANRVVTTLRELYDLSDGQLKSLGVDPENIRKFKPLVGDLDKDVQFKEGSMEARLAEGWPEIAKAAGGLETKKNLEKYVDIDTPNPSKAKQSPEEFRFNTLNLRDTARQLRRRLILDEEADVPASVLNPEKAYRVEAADKVVEALREQGAETPEMPFGSVATDDELMTMALRGLYGKEWYQKSNAQILEDLKGVDNKKFFAMTAAGGDMGPRENLIIAMKHTLREKYGAYGNDPSKYNDIIENDVNQWKLLKTDSSKGTQPDIVSAGLRGEPIPSPKLGDFQGALQLKKSMFPSDMWVIRQVTGADPNKGLSKSAYDYANGRLRHVSRKMGFGDDGSGDMMFQAAAWVGYKQQLADWVEAVYKEGQEAGIDVRNLKTALDKIREGGDFGFWMDSLGMNRGDNTYELPELPGIELTAQALPNLREVAEAGGLKEKIITKINDEGKEVKKRVVVPDPKVIAAYTKANPEFGQMALELMDYNVQKGKDLTKTPKGWQETGNKDLGNGGKAIVYYAAMQALKVKKPPVIPIKNTGAFDLPSASQWQDLSGRSFEKQAIRNSKKASFDADNYFKEELRSVIRAAITDAVKGPERHAMGAGPRDHSPADFDVTNKQVNGQATSNRGTMPRQASSSMMPPSAPNINVSTQPVSKTGMSSDATRMDRGAALANMREKFMKYRKTELIEMLQPYVKADPNFSLTDAQGKKRRTSLFKADKYSLANAIAEKYEESEEYPVMGQSQTSPAGSVQDVEVVDVPGKPEKPDTSLAEQIADLAKRGGEKIGEGFGAAEEWLEGGGLKKLAASLLKDESSSGGMGLKPSPQVEQQVPPQEEQQEVERPDVVTPEEESQKIQELVSPDPEFSEAVTTGLEKVLIGQESDLEDRLREGLDKYSEATLGPNGKPETLSDYYTRTIGSVDNGTTVDFETVGSMSFYTTADGETKIVYKPEGEDEDRVFTLDQLRESVNDETYHKLADKVLQEDIKKWAGIHEKMKIIAPSDMDFIMQNVNQGARDIGMFSKEQKKKIMQAASTGAAYWGKENGGIDVQDYKTSDEVFEAALQSIENNSATYENYIKQAGSDHGFKPSKDSSVFDNFTRATRHMMGVASRQGWKPNSNKSSIENMYAAHAFLDSKAQAQKDESRRKRKDMMWKVLGGAGALYVASVLYMIRQSTR